MNTVIFCFSDSGARLALRLSKVLELPGGCIHSNKRFADIYGFSAHESVFDDMGALFRENDALIFIGACGIAVRAVAPHIKSKLTDPAVLVIDDRGSFVIPLLSGHIGGGNELARQVADLLNATAVITTATDIEGRFSCDAWAARNDCAVSSMDLAKEVSAAILTRDIPVSSGYELPESLPEGLIHGETGELGIYIGEELSEPYSRTLRLIPRTISVGIGCRRGTAKEAILNAVSQVFKDNDMDIRAIKHLASIDIKRNETGLREAAEELHAPTVFFTADELNAARGEFSESDFVRNTVGTGNVCGRAAVLSGGKLIVHKTALNGVTVALAREDRRIEL